MGRYAESPDRRTLWRAIWRDPYAKGKVHILLCSATFEKKPKSWRLIQTFGGQDFSDGLGPTCEAWHYRTHFKGDEPPGFESPALAVRDLLITTRRHIEGAEQRLKEERAKLELCEAEYRKLTHSTQI